MTNEETMRRLSLTQIKRHTEEVKTKMKYGPVASRLTGLTLAVLEANEVALRDKTLSNETLWRLSAINYRLKTII